VVREFAVAIFVVHDGRVLLHQHRKLGRWLPPGGHVEAGETPDEAAVRETLEETGLHVELIDAPLGVDAAEAALEDEPRRLAQPLGIQLEDIPPDHQHIDLIYVARVRPGTATAPRAAAGDEESRPGWFAPDQWERLGMSREVRRWARAAVALAAPAAVASHLV
jgi:8-oxo-dGTP pyrophosphatase MutT (NUDIX family)